MCGVCGMCGLLCVIQVHNKLKEYKVMKAIGKCGIAQGREGTQVFLDEIFISGEMLIITRCHESLKCNTFITQYTKLH